MQAKNKTIDEKQISDNHAPTLQLLFQFGIDFCQFFTCKDMLGVVAFCPESIPKMINCPISKPYRDRWRFRMGGQ